LFDLKLNVRKLEFSTPLSQMYAINNVEIRNNLDYANTSNNIVTSQ